MTRVAETRQIYHICCPANFWKAYPAAWRSSELKTRGRALRHMYQGQLLIRL